MDGNNIIVYPGTVLPARPEMSSWYFISLFRSYLGAKIRFSKGKKTISEAPEAGTNANLSERQIKTMG